MVPGGKVLELVIRVGPAFAGAALALAGVWLRGRRHERQLRRLHEEAMSRRYGNDNTTDEG